MARKIDRLQAANMSNRGVQTWSQRVAEQIEANFADAEAATAAAAAAAADALSAATQALAAINAANAVKLTDKISASSVVPANVLSATDAGTDATVTVAAHTRVYGDSTQLSVGGHNFTGKAYSTKYAVYYDDTTCADTSPTYRITTTLSNAVANFASGRHFVGIVTTPASGGGATSGGSSAPGTDPADKPDFSTL